MTEGSAIDLGIVINGINALLITLCLVVVFLFFRKRYKWVYSPNIAPYKHHPILSNTSKWDWLRYTISLSDTKLLTLIGLDAFTFIMTLKLLFSAFLWLSLFSILTLIPLYSLGSESQAEIYTSLSISNLKARTSWLWIPFLFTWIASFYLFYIIFTYYDAIVTLRQAYSAQPSSLNSIHQIISLYQITGSIESAYSIINHQSQTILLEGLEKEKFKSEDHLVEFLNNCGIGKVKEVIFIKDHPNLRMLMDNRNAILRRLETAYMNFLKGVMLDIEKDSKGIQVEHLPDALKGIQIRNLLESSGLSSEDKKELLSYTLPSSFMTYYRPTRRASCLHFTTKIDLINELTAKLKHWDTKILEERENIMCSMQKLASKNVQFQREQYAIDKALMLDNISPKQSDVTVKDDHTRQISQESQTREELASKVRQRTMMAKYHNLTDDSTTFLPLRMGSKDTFHDLRLLLPGVSRKAFVTFQESISANIIQQCLIDPELFAFQSYKAPHANEILWQNLTLTFSNQKLRSFTCAIIYIFIMLIWALPVTFIKSLNQISEIAKTFPFLSFIQNWPEKLQALVESSLSPLLLCLLLVTVPYIFEGLSLFQGHISRSESQRSLLRKYIYFLYIQVFLVTFLSGSIWAAIEPIMKNQFQEVIDMIKDSISKNSSFIFNLIILRIPFDTFFTLANPAMLGWSMVTKGIFTNQTPREKQESRQSTNINYGVLYSTMIFVVPLILTYATISPVMIFIGFLYYFIAYYAYRYQFLYACKTEFESGGDHWQDVVDFFILSIYTFQIMTILQLSVQRGTIQAIFMIPLLLLTRIFSKSIHSTYDKRSDFLPLGRRSDLASMKEYEKYHRSIPKKHLKDALFVTEFEDYSALSLIGKLISRQKDILACLILHGDLRVKSGEAVTLPSDMSLLSEESKKIIYDTDTSFACTTVSSIDKVISSEGSEESKSEASPSSYLSKRDEDEEIEQEAKDMLSWYMNNPYRSPMLFRRLNSLYLPKHFFKIVKLVRDKEMSLVETKDSSNVSIEIS